MWHKEVQMWIVKWEKFIMKVFDVAIGGFGRLLNMTKLGKERLGFV